MLKFIFSPVGKAAHTLHVTGLGKVRTLKCDSRTWNTYVTRGKENATCETSQATQPREDHCTTWEHKTQISSENRKKKMRVWGKTNILEHT